jgi:hypothetical protein
MSADHNTHPENTMTQVQMGKRMDNMEQDVSLLKMEVTKTTAAVDGMRGDINIMFTKLDQVIASSTSTTANRGMVSWHTVAWGIGLILSLTGLGITITSVGAGVVLYAMGQSADMDTMRMDYIVQLEDARHLLVQEQTGSLQKNVAEIKGGDITALQTEVQQLREHVTQASERKTP